MPKPKKDFSPASALLDKPRILFSEPGTPSQCLFYGALLALGSAGALGCFFGAFQVPVEPLPALLTGAVCLAFSLFLFLNRRPSWVVSLAGIGLWAAAVWHFFDQLLQGCAHTVNLVLAAYGDKLNTALPMMDADPSLSQQELQSCCTLFCCLFAFPYLFFLGWALVGRKSCLGAFCLTGLMLCVPLLISLVPPAPWLAALLLFWAVLLLFSPSFGKRHRLLEDHGRYHAAGNALARPAMLLLFLSGAALCMAFTLWLVPYSTYQRPQIAADLRDGFTNGFGLEASLRGGVGSGNSRVDLNSLGSRSYTGETVLRVHYQWEQEDGSSAPPANRQKDYLKSFVGSVYTGDSWERLASQDQRELSNLLDGEHPQLLLDRFSQEFYAPSASQYTLSVENTATNPRCVYVPYGLMGDSVDGASLEFVSDGFLQSARFFSGTSAYQLRAWGIPNSALFYPTQAQQGLLDGYARSQGVELDSSLDWLQIPGIDQLLEELNASLMEAPEGPAFASLDLWTIPEDLRSYLTPQQQELSQRVEAYNRFVYDHYTQLPEDLRATLEQYLADNHLEFASAGSSAMMYSPFELVQQVANTLAAQCVYTLTPPALPEGRDFVEFFLLESHQGYCVHFASAAAALLRAMGIPARYAEGYAVPAGEEGWVDVPDYNAHAWVEIYLGGMGWIPVEVTPAGPDAPAATEDARPLEANLVSPTPAPTPSPSPSPSPTPQASPSASPTAEPGLSPSPAPGQTEPGQGPSSTPDRWSWLPALAAGGILLLLAAGVLLRRRVLLRLREKRFHQKDPNQNALALYAALLRLHQEAERYQRLWNQDLPPQLEELALKARFSQHTLTPEEVAVFRQEWDAARESLQSVLTLPQQLWFRYGLCLF